MRIHSQLTHSSTTISGSVIILCVFTLMSLSGCDAEDDPTLTGGGVTAGVSGSGGAQVSGEQAGGQ